MPIHMHYPNDPAESVVVIESAEPRLGITTPTLQDYVVTIYTKDPNGDRVVERLPTMNLKAVLTLRQTMRRQGWVSGPIPTRSVA